MKHNLCVYVLIATVILILPCALAEASIDMTISSQLEIVTFWNDFVFVKWYFKVNLSEPDLKMTMLISDNVLEENINLPVVIFPIDKEIDPLTNYTTFFVESPLPLGTLSNDFPNDRYEATYFVGCNFLPQTSSLTLGGNIPGPTNNYQAQWELRTDPNFLEKSSNLPSGMLEEYTHWLRMHLSIFHRPPFQEYVGTLVKEVPLCLQVFGWILAISIFLPIFYDYTLNRSLKSKRIVLIEHVMIPISAAIIVFIPVYILALQVFETPLTIPKIQTTLINVLYLYLIILAIGIVLRVISLEAETLKPKEEVAQKNESCTRAQLSKNERQVLIEEYRVLNSAIWDRGRSVWFVNSVLIPSSILIVLQATIYHDKLGNVVAGIFSIFSFLLAMYCLLHLILSNKVNKVCWGRINQIEGILGIEGNRRIYSEIQTKMWYYIRSKMWQVLLYLLTGAYLLVSIWNFLPQVF